MQQAFRPSDTRLTPHEERVIAVKAGCDPRTVRSYRLGKTVTSTTAARISQALAEFAAPRSPSSAPPPQAA